MEFGELRKEIRAAGHRKWQSQWDAGLQGRYRYEVDPVLSRGRIIWKERDNEVFFIRMRLGVVKTPSWRHLILREGTGLCARGCNESDGDVSDEDEPSQDGVHDTLRHILFECVHLETARNKGEREIRKVGGKWTLTEMLETRETYLAVIGFLRESNLYKLLVYYCLSERYHRLFLSFRRRVELSIQFSEYNN